MAQCDGSDSAAGTITPARDRLDRARLCVLLDGGADAADFERRVDALCGAGVAMLQLRDKQLPDDALLDRCRRALAIARRRDPRDPPLVIVNDRVAVAAAAGADGVHLGATDMPLAQARERLGPAFLIGRTAHDIGVAEAAVTAGADYLGIGPCYPSVTKSFAQHAPGEFLRAAAGLPLPVFAIGGITATRVPELIALGIRRVAVSAAVTAAPDPAAATHELLTAIKRG